MMLASITSHINRVRGKSFHIIIVVFYSLYLSCREQDTRIHEETLGEDMKKRETS